MKREHAYKLRDMIYKASLSLDDSDALEAVELFPVWESNIQYSKDYRVRYKGILYKCLQEHTSQETWAPTDAPSLWAQVLIPDPDVIPEWVQPDSTNPYMIGDKVMHNSSKWICTIDNNVWEPGVYGWDPI